MYCIDIPTLADMLRNSANGDISEDAYRVYAETVVDRVVELYNTPADTLERDILWDNITESFTYLLPHTEVSAIIDEHLRFLTEAANKNGWDPRLHVKCTRHKLAKEYHKCLLKMDLDSTLMKMFGASLLGNNAGEDVADAVEDNPSLEMLQNYERNLTTKR